ncbi:hypothetical protein [Janthinobacterium sp.]|uniref:hypothetical protein n=1 Tax=Janthinobacterium sp. TaxID=1871054 RepID=UPI00293D7503|nr:hypothetical protein [Janthinobacterium sp.]
MVAALWVLAGAALGLLSLIVLWIMYLAVMALQRARDAGALSPFAMRAGQALLAVGIVWDVLCNLLPVTVIFMELPREATVSARLRRLVRGPDGWRRRLAVWYAAVLLNPFSPGGPHIEIPQ